MSFIFPWGEQSKDIWTLSSPAHCPIQTKYFKFAFMASRLKLPYLELPKDSSGTDRLLASFCQSGRNEVVFWSVKLHYMYAHMLGEDVIVAPHRLHGSLSQLYFLQVIFAFVKAKVFWCTEFSPVYDMLKAVHRFL